MKPVNYSITSLHDLIHESCNNRIHSLDVWESESNENVTNFLPATLLQVIWYSSVIFTHTERSIRHKPCWGLVVPTAANNRVLISFFASIRFSFHSSYVKDSSLLGCDTVLLCEWVLTFQRNVLSLSSCVSSSKRPLTHEDKGTTHPKTKHKIPTDLSIQ